VELLADEGRIMWIALTAIAGISLLVFWRSPNGVWGGATIGAIGGVIVAAISAWRGDGFSWLTAGKGVVIGVLLGAGAELVALLANRAKKRAER
jgi:hypothetical protein